MQRHHTDMSPVNSVSIDTLQSWFAEWGGGVLRVASKVQNQPFLLWSNQIRELELMIPMFPFQIKLVYDTMTIFSNIAPQKTNPVHCHPSSCSLKAQQLTSSKHLSLGKNKKKKSKTILLKEALFWKDFIWGWPRPWGNSGRRQGARVLRWWRR